MPHARTGTRAAPRRVRFIYPQESTCPACKCVDYISASAAKDAPRRYRKCKACPKVYVVRATHEELDEGGPLSRIRPL